MKKGNKLIALMLVVALIASLALVFTACGDEKAEEETKVTETVYTDKIPNLKILYENDNSLKNIYSMYVVNEGATFRTADGTATTNTVKINTAGAIEFVKWMSLPTTRALIAAYGIEDYQEALFYLDSDAFIYDGTITPATEDTKVIRLSTTTSVNDTGLLDSYLVPLFEKWYGYDVQVSSAGTGKALNAARMGNADAVLVHSPSSEKNFIAEGYAKILDSAITGCSSKTAEYTYEKPATDTTDLCPTGSYTASGTRLTFMYNFFVLVGPNTDPAGAASADTVLAAFDKIFDSNSGTYKFISRGDASGTHNAEIKLWGAGMKALWPAGKVTNVATDVPQSITGWYISAGTGMGACLTMANEKNAYILTDKGTFLRYKNFPEEVVVKG